MDATEKQCWLGRKSKTERCRNAGIASTCLRNRNCRRLPQEQDSAYPADWDYRVLIPARLQSGGGSNTQTANKTRGERVGRNAGAFDKWNRGFVRVHFHGGQSRVVADIRQENCEGKAEKVVNVL